MRIWLYNLVIFLVAIQGIKAQNVDEKVKKHLQEAENQLKRKNYEKTREYALKALELNQSNGKAYIIIGLAYVSTVDSCFNKSFSKDMTYCLAVDMFEKAKQIDTTVSERATKLVKLYSNYFPDGEILSQAKEGDKYFIKCWINRETTIRFRK